MAIAGGCLCGAVRFEIDADAPLTDRQCWCRVCQYLGACRGMVSAGFLKDAVNVSGPLTDYVSYADSGSVMHRRFRPQCGTQVFSEAEPRPHLIFVRVGALDDPNLAWPNAAKLSADCGFNLAAPHPAYPIKRRPSAQRTQASEGVETQKSLRHSALDDVDGPTWGHLSAERWSLLRHQEGGRPCGNISELASTSPRIPFKSTRWRAKIVPPRNAN